MYLENFLNVSTAIIRILYELKNVVFIVTAVLKYLMSSLLFLSITTATITVKLGTDTQQSLSPNEVTRAVSQVIVHSGYDPSKLNNDLALVKLSSPVSFNNYIRPVCLAASGSNFKDGSSCWIAGWGRITTGSKNLFSYFFYVITRI